MAHTKQKGSTKNARDSESKRLGVKLFGGQSTEPGNVIIRQRGTKYLPGSGVKIGGDDTLYALKKGVIQFKKKKLVKFDGSKKTSNIVSVV